MTKNKTRTKMYKTNAIASFSATFGFKQSKMKEYTSNALGG